VERGTYDISPCRRRPAAALLELADCVGEARGHTRGGWALTGGVLETGLASASRAVELLLAKRAACPRMSRAGKSDVPMPSGSPICSPWVDPSQLVPPGADSGHARPDGGRGRAGARDRSAHPAPQKNHGADNLKLTRRSATFRGQERVAIHSRADRRETDPEKLAGADRGSKHRQPANSSMPSRRVTGIIG